MFDRLRRLARIGVLLREVKGIRQELRRVADAMELANAHTWPQPVPADPALPVTEISYVSTAYQAELMEIESGLTLAKGVPPNEDEIVAEYHRRHPQEEALL